MAQLHTMTRSAEALLKNVEFSLTHRDWFAEVVRFGTGLRITIKMDTIYQQTFDLFRGQNDAMRP